LKGLGGQLGGAKGGSSGGTAPMMQGLQSLMKGLGGQMGGQRGAASGGSAPAMQNLQGLLKGLGGQLGGAKGGSSGGTAPMMQGLQSLMKGLGGQMGGQRGAASGGSAPAMQNLQGLLKGLSSQSGSGGGDMKALTQQLQRLPALFQGLQQKVGGQGKGKTVDAVGAVKALADMLEKLGQTRGGGKLPSSGSKGSSRVAPRTPSRGMRAPSSASSHALEQLRERMRRLHSQGK
jgi:hypothetical protein